MLFFDETLVFVALSERADGELVRVEHDTDEFGHESWAPVIRFRAGDADVEITGEWGSSVPRHVGRVQVFYRKSDPKSARIAGFRDLLFAPTVLGAFAFLCAIPALILRRHAGDESARTRALRDGTPFRARITAIRQEQFTVNDESPWRIDAEARDAASGTTCAFTSHALWMSPLGHYQVGDEVTVHRIPGEPEVYAFALDKLPAAS